MYIQYSTTKKDGFSHGSNRINKGFLNQKGRFFTLTSIIRERGEKKRREEHTAKNYKQFYFNKKKYARSIQKRRSKIIVFYGVNHRFFRKIRLCSSGTQKRSVF